MTLWRVLGCVLLFFVVASDCFGALEARPRGGLDVVSAVTIAEGIAYTHYTYKRYNGIAVLRTPLHVLRATLADNVRVRSVLAAERLGTRDTVTNMAGRTGAVAAINGDFFDTRGTGVALGPHVAEGVMVTSPTALLSGMYALGITTDGKLRMGPFVMRGHVIASGMPYALAGVNRPAAWVEGKHTHAHALHVYTDAWGGAVRGHDGATTPSEALVVDGVVQRLSIGAPLDGGVPTGAVVLRAAGAAAEWMQANVRIGEPVQWAVSLDDAPQEPTITDRPPFAELPWQMVIGGHTVLIANGQAAAFSRSVQGIQGYGATARTAIGYDESGRTVTLVVAEHSNQALGLTLAELQDALLELGVWQAVNLDGGGSSAMAVRMPWEQVPTLRNVPKDGKERNVVNGVAVVHTPAVGAQRILDIDRKTALWKGERAAVRLYVRDEFGIGVPAQLRELTTSEQFSLDPSDKGAQQPDGTVDGVIPISAVRAGVGRIAVRDGDTIRSVDRVVRDAQSIVQLRIEPEIASDVWVQGQRIGMDAYALLQDGTEERIPSSLLTWKTFGMKADIEEGALVFRGWGTGESAAIEVAYDGFIGSYVVPNPALAPVIWAQSVPMSFGGDVPRGQWVMPAGGDGASVRAVVEGDGGLFFVQAQFVDRNDAVVASRPVTVRGGGRRTVTFVPDGPARLTHIEVFSADDVVRTATLHRVWDAPVRLPARPRAVTFVLGQSTADVEGATQKLDVPPSRVNGVTYVPLRYVVDALGGTVLWERDALTMMRRLSHVVIQSAAGVAYVSGRRVPLLQPLRVREGRTLVPLRVVAQLLGMNVSWDAPTKTIVVRSE
ncbi:MAG: phosphodiester glycosidase family protein [Paenibacillaceae bacterium]|nr:phosphodiester glycosidase family protein [Paenibacillaceae bacterium]